MTGRLLTGRVRLAQLGVLLGGLAIWAGATRLGILPPFFFGEPLPVLLRTWSDFASGQIFHDLWITAIEALLAFGIGTSSGIVLGFLFARGRFASAVLEPFVKAANALPRVVLAPIFALWFGLGIWSKVALGVTLVFFVVFFNVYQGVREVPRPILANARMLGLDERQLTRHVYLPAALSWVFASLHTAVGFALVGAVVGEYLGSAAGLGYRIAQAEGVFDITGVISSMLVLTGFVLLIDAAVSVAERRLLRWRPAGGGMAQ